ncbi:hypothetical protein BH09SUM1_BH09SUM1_25090 [soil metagenome]
MKTALIIFLILDVLLIGGAAYRMSTATPETPSLLATSSVQPEEEPVRSRGAGNGQAAISRMAGKDAMPPAENVKDADDPHNRDTNTNDAMDKGDAINESREEDLKKAKKKISILVH